MFFDPSYFAIGLLAVIIDRFVGYPEFLYRRVAHPVVWIGEALNKLDSRLNKPGLPGIAVLLLGICALSILITLVTLITVPLNLFLGENLIGKLGLAVLSSSLLAQKSLRQHADAVIDGLEKNLTEGRNAVSKIIGRDTKELDQSEVCKGTIESIAENTSDGVVAPLLWLLVAGLPGIAIYKAINTADSMIAHKSRQYKEFGWFTAHIDDLVNLPASRITSALIACAAYFHKNGQYKRAVKSIWQYASKHVSPNAGWPESAMAGALGFRLGGPRHYEGKIVALAYIGSGKSDLTIEDIKNSLQIYDIALNLIACILVVALISIYL